jgi:parallel beta-helix repeat protein
MQLIRRTRVELLAAAGIVAVAVILLGALVLSRRHSDNEGAPGQTRPVAPTTSPSEIPLNTSPPPTVSPSLTLPPLAANVPNPGPTSFPSPTCSNVNSNAKFVALDGNDRNPGTKDAPYRTINHAQQQIRHGQTLFIRGGTYYQLSPTGEQDNFIEIDSRGKGSDTQWLAFCAYPGERPVLVANATDAGPILVRGTDHVHIEGLEVIGPAFGRQVEPPRGGHSAGVFVGAHPNPKTEANHTRIWNNWIHGFGGSGIQLNLSNNTDIRGNLIWDNAHWSEFATSGISLFWQSKGSGNDKYGFGNYIVGNLIWDNYMDDSLFDPSQPFGLTDGNCIIVDESGHFTDTNSSTRTLIRNNICVANGGPGVALARSANVEIVNNTFYMNNLTTLQTVVKNGEFMCQGMQKRDTVEGRSVFTKCDRVKYANNVVVGRPDRPSLYTTFFDAEVQFEGNVWVKSGFDAKSSSDKVLPSETAVIRVPNMEDPRAGDWTTVGEAAGKGAYWPLDWR